MLYYLTPQAKNVIEANRLAHRPNETPLDRYHRLYSNLVYNAFKREAEYSLSDPVAAAVLLSDAAREACYLFQQSTVRIQYAYPTPKIYKGKIQELASLNAGRGTSLNLKAISFLMRFHPQAIDLYFGRAAK